MDTRRLNITLTKYHDDLLSELASLTGRSKASYVLDALSGSERYLVGKLNHLRSLRNPSAQPADVAESVVEEESLPLTRQQRRALERQQAKKGRHR